MDENTRTWRSSPTVKLPVNPATTTAPTPTYNARVPVAERSQPTWLALVHAGCLGNGGFGATMTMGYLPSERGFLAGFSIWPRVAHNVVLRFIYNANSNQTYSRLGDLTNKKTQKPRCSCNGLILARSGAAKRPKGQASQPSSFFQVVPAGHRLLRS